jgi:hypothetical protein
MVPEFEEVNGNLTEIAGSSMRRGLDGPVDVGAVGERRTVRQNLRSWGQQTPTFLLE